MKLNEFNQELEEQYFSRPEKVSKRAEKVVNQLQERREKIEKELDKNDLTQEKRREYKDILKAIDKSLPVIEDFKKYFTNLEKKIKDLPDKEKRKKVESKYKEVKELFISELFKIMQFVGYNGSFVIGAAIASLIFAIIFIPGGGPILMLPTVMLIKKIRENQEKMKNMKRRQFEKEIDKLIDTLERKKKKRFSSY